MKKTKIINGLLCTVLLLQSLTGVGVTVFAEEGTTSNDSTEIISQSLSESVGLIEERSGSLPKESYIKVEENLSESNNELSSSETVNEKEIISESSSEVISESTVNEEAESKQVEEKIKIPEDIIADGTYGTVPWYITKEGTLVLEGGTLPDVEKYTIYQSPWYQYSASINKIVIEDAVIATAHGADYLFKGLEKSRTINGLGKIDFSQAVSLRYLFSNTGLETLDVSLMDVSRVTDASAIFEGVNLEELDVSNWDITNVHSINQMFASSDIDEVTGLEEWYLPNLKDTSGAFSESEFKNLDLSNWRPNRIEYMGGMFSGSIIESVDLSGWDTSNLSTSYIENDNIFYETPNLKKITLDSDTRFSKESYNHQSEKKRDDIWEGINTKRIYENTTWLLRDYQRESDTFIRKEQIFHNVTFKDHYSIGNDYVTEVKEGETVWIPQNPTTEGYEFNGWYVDEEFSKLYNFSTPINEDITIYAKWVPNVNRVTFNSKGGTAVEDQIVLTGETVELPKSPEKEGLYFSGWFLNDWDYEPYDFSTPIQGDLELKARWSFILSFETNGANKIPNQYFDNQVAYPISPEIPWKKGYEFLGWYSDKEFKQPFSFFDGTVLNQSTTLYAKYNKNGEQLDLYGSLNKAYEHSYELYNDEKFDNNISDEVDLIGATFNIKESFTSNTGQSYYSIFDNRGWIGYIPEYSVEIASGKEGLPDELSQYVILNDMHQIIPSFNEMDKEIAGEYKNRTFLAKDKYNHFNGEKYVSLYNKQGTLIGYINEAGVNKTDSPQGPAYNYDKYTTIIDDSIVIWYDLTFSFGFYTSDYINKTLLVKDVYYHFDGENYVSIIDNQGNLLGYTREDYINISNSAQGEYQSFDKYVSIQGNNDIWSGFDWTDKKNGRDYQNQTFEARGVYYHFNGSSYLSLYDNQGKWFGYINKGGTTVASGPQGVHQNYVKYVSLRGNNDIWSGFDWKDKKNGRAYQNQTFEARGVYYHFNGSSYLSLYDNQGKWFGYINKGGTTVASGPQGVHQNYGKYVSLRGDNDIWSGFDWKDKKNGRDYQNQTFEARGVYRHFNGSSYLSLYDNQGKWIGYINEGGTTVAVGQQGAYQNYGKYVTIKGNNDIWDSFQWKNKIPGSKYQNQTLHAKGVYHHFNGSRYLSVYDNKNKWVGYINENGTQLAKNKGGIALSAKFNRKVVKRNYTLWNDLDFKKKKGNSNQYLNQTLYVKVQYNHFNGSKYYSLYNANNKWLGYINANGTK